MDGSNSSAAGGATSSVLIRVSGVLITYGNRIPASNAVAMVLLRCSTITACIGHAMPALLE